MMYRRNVAAQPVYASMIDLAGNKLDASVSVAVSKDGGATAPGGGTLTNLGAGRWAYTPTAAEFDCTSLGVFFEHASGVTIDRTVRTTTANPDDAAGFGISRIDTTVSSRSTFAGGAVASVTDRTGFKLADDGLDAVTVESGENARQVLRLFRALLLGLVTPSAGVSPFKRKDGSRTAATVTTAAGGTRTNVTIGDLT